MKTILIQAILLITLSLLTTINLCAQVKIGDTTPPVAGALLELNQGATTTKGLGLPRVKLTSLTIPAGKSLAQTIDGTAISDNWNAADHVGLLVYQTEHNIVASPAICKGLYVWTGDSWQSLQEINMPADITMTDADGNVYNAKWFTSNPCDPSAPGAYWTTSNLYSAQKGTGGAFTSGQPRLNPASYNVTPGVFIAVDIPPTGIPAGTVDDYGVSTTLGQKNITGQSYKDFAKEYGLLYTGPQGNEACPTGWHLPTVQEWTDLATWLGGASVAGAKMRKASTWKYYYVSREGRSLQWGQSDGDTQPTPSGFDAVPSGYGLPGLKYADNFSFLAYWRAAPGYAIYHIYYHSTILNVASHADYYGAYFPVRCVKD